MGLILPVSVIVYKRFVQASRTCAVTLIVQEENIYQRNKII